MATGSSHSTSRQSPKRAWKKRRTIILDEDSSIFSKLPQELILEILLRLPVKSLLQFKGVCKSWRATISNPKFVKKHLNLVSKYDAISPWRIIIQYPYRNLKSYSLHSIFHEPHGYAVTLDYMTKSLDWNVKIVGSCDGLVCIYFSKNEVDIIYIWNPTTRESHILPCSKGFHFTVSYGFGYDSVNDDYKVVRVYYVPADCPLKVEIYSLRTNSWMIILDFPINMINFHPTESGKFVNGSLNWVTINTSTDAWVITALDLAKETYREIPQPNYGNKFYMLSIRALRGCLCVVCGDGFTFLDMWVMNDYGMKESWAKLVSITHMPELWPFPCSPLWYLKDGRILVNFNRTFVLYDLIEYKFKRPLIYDVHTSHEADIYLETLVSPRALIKVPVDLNK